jgi:hypothetical protein
VCSSDLLVTAFVSFMFLIEDAALKNAFSETARILRKGAYFLFYDIIGRKKTGKEIRGFQKKEVIALANYFGLSLVSQDTICRNFYPSKNNRLYALSAYGIVAFN